MGWYVLIKDVTIINGTGAQPQEVQISGHVTVRGTRSAVWSCWVECAVGCMACLHKLPPREARVCIEPISVRVESVVNDTVKCLHWVVGV